MNARKAAGVETWRDGFESTVCFLAMHLSIYRIGKRIDRIVTYTRVIQSGNLKDKLPILRDDEFTVIERGINVMTEKLEHYIEEKYSADIALKKAQIQSLQPIVENCLNHGFTPDMENCRITLEAEEGEAQQFYIAISDNGLGMPKEYVAQLEEMLASQMEGYHVGMRNIHQRIQLLFGVEFGLRIESREGEGTRIPYDMRDWPGGLFLRRVQLGYGVVIYALQQLVYRHECAKNGWFI